LSIASSRADEKKRRLEEAAFNPHQRRRVEETPVEPHES